MKNYANVFKVEFLPFAIRAKFSNFARIAKFPQVQYQFFKRGFNLAKSMRNSRARQLMEIKLSAIIMESRLELLLGEQQERAESKGRNQRERTGVDSTLSSREREREEEDALASKSEKLVACLPELGRDREGKREAATTRTMLTKRKRERERERENRADGRRKSKWEGERQSVFV